MATATLVAGGRETCDGVHTTVPVMIAKGGFGEGVGSSLIGLAGGRGDET